MRAMNAGRDTSRVPREVVVVMDISKKQKGGSGPKQKQAATMNRKAGFDNPPTDLFGGGRRGRTEQWRGHLPDRQVDGGRAQAKQHA